MTYRPRGRLARAMYDKCIADDFLRTFDKTKWYEVDLQYLPSNLQSSFTQLQIDTETEAFLENSTEKSSWLLTQMWHLLIKSLLGFFITQTSINGLLRRGSMFVFSRDQFLTMLPVHCPAQQFYDESSCTRIPTRLIDLGAGDGAATAVVADLYDQVHVTEVSPTMRRVLTQRGFVVVEIDEWAEAGIKYDCVLCLNLLDRCDRPLDILADIRRVLPPHGRLVLALVLPFRPYVETGASDHMPSQKLNITGERFEDQVHSVVENVLSPAGFSVVSWSRLPYLCEGDLAQAYYWLDDALFVLKPT